MSSFYFIHGAIPDWASVLGIAEPDFMKVRITPPGAPWFDGMILDIQTSLSGGVKAEVSTDDISARLPAFCCERHINPDSSFCLSKGSVAPLQDSFAAQLWWASLEAYFRNQNYARITRLWPITEGLSHGVAADTQERMEAACGQFRPLKEEILLAIFRKKGWLSGDLPRLNKKGRLYNGRSPCPRGCTILHGASKKEQCILKKCGSECKKNHPAILKVACPNREKIETVIYFELERRKQENKMMDEVRKTHICCGTMKYCPLRKAA